MWCVRCNNDLFDCVCPDKDARVRSLDAPGSLVKLEHCALCSEPIYLCKCPEIPKAE